MSEDSKFYKRLKKSVLAGELEILYIVSPPRTISTILEIALAEYGHGQIHEPFHKRRRQDFDDGCRIVYERFLELNKKSPDKPIRLVIKDLSKFITPDEWEKLAILAKNFVFTIREPSKQIFSMTSRYANDLENYDADRLSYDQILKNIPRIPFKDLAFDYWENLLDLYKITQNNIVSTKDEHRHVAIISGMSFRIDPLDSLEKLVDYLELEVKPNKLLKNWTIGSGDNFFRPEYIINRQPNDKDFSRGAWLGPAINSQSFWGLDIKADAPKDINIYDSHLQNYFLHNIMPVYVKLYLDKNNICKPDLETVGKKNFQKSLLMKTNAIEAYLLCNSFQKADTTQYLDLRKNSEYAKGLVRKNYPTLSQQLFTLVEKE